MNLTNIQITSSTYMEALNPSRDICTQQFFLKCLHWLTLAIKEVFWVAEYESHVILQEFCHAVTSSVTNFENRVYFGQKFYFFGTKRANSVFIVQTRLYLRFLPINRDFHNSNLKDCSF